ncbi:MAG: cell division protein FtsX [Pseudomonadales bacterium]|nr:permease-like cell division protein FtsX [Pseudomonadales bacterium]MCP5344507.1 cell division protein FtsX [Pseudomonadales bacterium]
MNAQRRKGARESRVSTGGALLSRWQQHVHTARISLEKLRQSPGSSLMTIAVIGIALLLPTLLFVSVDNLSRLSNKLVDVSQISVYLQESVSRAEASEIGEQLLSRRDIDAVRYISADEAAQEFAATSGLGDVMQALGSNPLPAVLLVTPSALNSAVVNTLLEDLQSLRGVDNVQLDLAWVERLQTFLELAQRASTGLMGILAIAVLFVVGNTVRLAIESRRAEIVVIKLVGGTDAYVARPFLYTGAYYGLAGGLFAWGLLSVILLALRGPATELLHLYGSDYVMRALGFGDSLLLLAGSTLLGWLGAWISVRQHMSAIEPR